MVDRIESRRLLIPATYGAGNVTATDLGFTEGIVRSVAIVVPAGVHGAIGVGLGYGGQQVIPNTVGELIYTDNEVIVWPVDGLPVGARWQLITDPQAWNDHFIGVRMSVDEIPARSAGPTPPPVADEVMALAPPDPGADVTDDTADVPLDLAAEA